jgi:UDP-glucose 4-epimerase
MVREKVVIFGVAGFIGRNLAEYLRDKYQVIGSDIVEPSSKYMDVFIKADITNYHQVLNVVRGSDYIAHFAAHALSPSLTDPITNAMINIIGTLNILQAALTNGIRKILFTSASSVIGETTSSIVSENVLPKPKSPYAVTKLSCEHYFRIYGELWNVNYVVFRLFNVYGPYQKSGLIPNLYTKIVRDEPVEITGDGKQIRDFIYVKDAIKFFEEALKRDDCSKLLVNLGTGRGVKIIDVANILFKLLNKTPRILFIPRQKTEISNFVADTKLLKEKFGFLPETPLEVGIAETINWLKNETNSKIE